MRILKKFIGFLRFGSHRETHNENHEHNNHRNSDDIPRNRMDVDPIHTGPQKGFTVPVQVSVERHAVGPILLPCNADGGVQGLKWYATRLRTDEDGDVADEFLCEVSADASSIPQDQSKPLPSFQVMQDVKEAKIKYQVLTPDGKLQHCVDCLGELQWV